MDCCCRRPRTPPPRKRYATEVKPKVKAAPYSASELNEYAWGNHFQAHQRIGESVIEKENRIFQQLSSLGMPPAPAPPPRRSRLAACCCCFRCCGGCGCGGRQTHPDATEGMLIDALDAAQAAADAAPLPPVAATPKPEPADEDADAASPGEEVGTSFAPGGRAKLAFNGVPKRVAKKELFQNERERLLENRLANMNRTQGLDTPMQRERDLATKQAKERQQAMIEAGDDPFATPPRKKTMTPLRRQKQIEEGAQTRGYEGTDGHESRVAFLVAAREGWTATRPYETGQSPLKALQHEPPPPRPADWPKREELMQLKLLDLCQRCEALGVPDMQLDGAVQDPHNPKSAVITLLLDALTVKAAREAEEAAAVAYAEAAAYAAAMPAGAGAEAGAGLVEALDV